MTTKNKVQKTMSRSELVRLAFCNSKWLPHFIEIDGELKEWVGIGWVTVERNESSKLPVLIVSDKDNGNSKRSRRHKTGRT